MPDDFDRLTWHSNAGCWHGQVLLPSGSHVDVTIPSKNQDPLALEYSRLTFAQISSRIGDARAYAAKKLLEYYNYYNSHIKNGEQLSEEEFTQRMELEGIRFSAKGRARIDFSHTLYQGDYLNQGGLIVVEATMDGRLRKAYWLTSPDAEECRKTRKSN